ncbi:MAG TPA: DUF1294 domain-containing protein [Candidatus Magasanikbacteria bacterium]|nr:DUF1294 domain-containing protein [Candidatus Magasanikbacteria bacterium]
MIAWFISLDILTQIVLIYFLVINIITFFYFGLDKLKSQIPNRSRTSEKTLWILSLVGGSFGALLGMHFFRHKTKKISFQAILALILAGQILLIYFLI